MLLTLPYVLEVDRTVQLTSVLGEEWTALLTLPNVLGEELTAQSKLPSV